MQKNALRGTAIKAKIDHILEETRVVIPGTQALLGFQLTAVFQNAFGQISPMLQYAHLLSMGCIVITIILLMTPAAYHRIVEKGESTERFHVFASHMLVVAMGFLALGLSGDIFVVVATVVQSYQVAALAGAAGLFLCLGMWYGFTLYKNGH